MKRITSTLRAEEIHLKHVYHVVVFEALGAVVNVHFLRSNFTTHLWNLRTDQGHVITTIQHSPTITTA